MSAAIVVCFVVSHCLFFLGLVHIWLHVGRDIVKL